MLNILSSCKAEEGSRVFPPMAARNIEDDKIDSAGSVTSGRMEHQYQLSVRIQDSAAMWRVPGHRQK